MNSKIIKSNEYHYNSNQKSVFTNGCFDMFHVGHLHYLTEASKLGDILLVGINSDLSVKLIKGPKRPIIPDIQRAELVAALPCVTYVFIFDEPTPNSLIEQLCPNVLVKGSDWPLKEIAKMSPHFYQPEIKQIDLIPETSTSRIIAKVLSLQ